MYYPDQLSSLFPQGPDEGGIPSQFPLGEDVQFIQILREAQDFFGIDEDEAKEYFLVDHRTRNYCFSHFVFVNFNLICKL